jgi:predicted HTH transcriptional regulator
MKTKEEILEIIKNGEDSYHEFKKEISSFDSILCEIVAFANTKGGVLLVGVGDDGKIIGVDGIEKIEQSLSNMTADKIEPSLNITLQNITIEDKVIIYIEIPFDDKPYLIDGICWIRQGSRKQKASRDELVRLFAQSSLLLEDERVTKASIKDELDITQFYLYLDKKTSMLSATQRNEHNILLNNLNLANGEFLNVAGLLAFGKNISVYKPMLNIQCCYFDGNDSSNTSFLDKENIDGNIEYQYKNAMGFIKRNLKRIQIEDEFNQKGDLEIDEMAISEAIINALVHRDLSIRSSIKVFLYQDRLEIISVGSLPNHLNEEKIKNGVSLIRNQILHQVAQMILPFSGLGTGIKRILELEPKTKFINDKSKEQFITIFYRKGK